MQIAENWTGDAIYVLQDKIFLNLKESGRFVLVLFSASFLPKGRCSPFPRIRGEVMTENLLLRFTF